MNAVTRMALGAAAGRCLGLGLFSGDMFSLVIGVVASTLFIYNSIYEVY